MAAGHSLELKFYQKISMCSLNYIQNVTLRYLGNDVSDAEIIKRKKEI